MVFFSPVTTLGKGSGAVSSLMSGVSLTSQPTGSTLGEITADKQGRVFQFMRLSGTCTVGSLLYLTGTSLNWVVNTGTKAGQPLGISLIAPIVSGQYTWIHKYGINTSIQITATVGGLGASSLLVGGESAAGSLSAWLSGINTGIVAANTWRIGRSLTAATGSQTIGFIDLL